MSNENVIPLFGREKKNDRPQEESSGIPLPPEAAIKEIFDEAKRLNDKHIEERRKRNLTVKRNYKLHSPHKGE
jgi:hypothetical protein